MGRLLIRHVLGRHAEEDGMLGRPGAQIAGDVCWIRVGIDWNSGALAPEPSMKGIEGRRWPSSGLQGGPTGRHMLDHDAGADQPDLSLGTPAEHGLAGERTS